MIDTEDSKFLSVSVFLKGKNMNIAIIVAAGASRRMGATCADKLMLKIGGKEVLARTLLQYENAASIDGIVVVTSRERFETVERIVKEYNITKFLKVTEGGQTRQHSVQNGLSACPEADIVSIADGARPFTKSSHIDAVSAAAEEHGGALLCVALKDTVKVLSSDGFVDHTPPRETLLAAQTPQTFQRSLFAKLMQRAFDEGTVVTDDASIFETYGHKVFPVIGDYDNIKITTAEDIALAEAIAGKESL